MELDKELGKDGERLSLGKIKWGQERTPIMHLREQKNGKERKKKTTNKVVGAMCYPQWMERQTELEMDWSYDKTIFFLFNNGLSASASQSSVFGSKRPHRIQFIRVSSTKLIGGNIVPLCSGSIPWLWLSKYIKHSQLMCENVGVTEEVCKLLHSERVINSLPWLDLIIGSLTRYRWHF